MNDIELLSALNRLGLGGITTPSPELLVQLAPYDISSLTPANKETLAKIRTYQLTFANVPTIIQILKASNDNAAQDNPLIDQKRHEKQLQLQRDEQQQALELPYFASDAAASSEASSASSVAVTSSAVSSAAIDIHKQARSAVIYILDIESLELEDLAWFFEGIVYTLRQKASVIQIKEIRVVVDRNTTAQIDLTEIINLNAKIIDRRIDSAFPLNELFYIGNDYNVTVDPENIIAIATTPGSMKTIRADFEKGSLQNYWKNVWLIENDCVRPQPRLTFERYNISASSLIRASKMRARLIWDLNSRLGLKHSEPLSHVEAVYFGNIKALESLEKYPSADEVITLLELAVRRHQTAMIQHLLSKYPEANMTPYLASLLNPSLFSGESKKIQSASKPSTSTVTHIFMDCPTFFLSADDLELFIKNLKEYAENFNLPEKQIITAYLDLNLCMDAPWSSQRNRNIVKVVQVNSRMDKSKIIEDLKIRPMQGDAIIVVSLHNDLYGALSLLAQNGHKVFIIEDYPSWNPQLFDAINYRDLLEPLKTTILLVLEGKRLSIRQKFQARERIIDPIDNPRKYFRSCTYEADDGTIVYEEQTLQKFYLTQNALTALVRDIHNFEIKNRVLAILMDMCVIQHENSEAYPTQNGLYNQYLISALSWASQINPQFLIKLPTEQLMTAVELLRNFSDFIPDLSKYHKELLLIQFLHVLVVDREVTSKVTELCASLDIETFSEEEVWKMEYEEIYQQKISSPASQPVTSESEQVTDRLRRFSIFSNEPVGVNEDPDEAEESLASAGKCFS